VFAAIERRILCYRITKTRAVLVYVFFEVFLTNPDAIEFRNRSGPRPATSKTTPLHSLGKFRIYNTIIDHLKKSWTAKIGLSVYKND